MIITEYKPKIIRSERKTLVIEIRPDFSVIVRAPFKTSDSEIEAFLAEKERWVNKTLNKLRLCSDIGSELASFTKQEIEDMSKMTEQIISEGLEYYSGRVGATYKSVRIKPLVSIWGSCSAEGRLTFNSLLSLCPREVADYVIVHELCHRKEMNHSPRFWARVSEHCPNYKAHRLWLKQKGSALIGRMRKSESI